ncbi:uncharacterized protein LOC115769944 [Drosophila novamexicana]|uniref:uncharacterized protein LOC115769944 n=1 Tax=Drosophila novamexicana TaxID=47314 RepID=UPI0011E5CF06|nr:uncharacterized protein LOC115769944 [Drosophila novamexicana]
MSESMTDIIPAVPREELCALQTVISKLEDHLKTTNVKLFNFRKLIRTESNIKSRNIYLSKVYSMVKEQHTIQRILENYQTKLKDLEARNKQKSDGTNNQQHTKNAKLFELFHNYEPIETRFENKQVKTCEPLALAKKRKSGDDGKIEDLKDARPKPIVINNHGETMKFLKAHVKKRIIEGEQKSKVEFTIPVINIVDDSVHEAHIVEDTVGKAQMAEETKDIDAEAQMEKEPKHVDDGVQMEEEAKHVDDEVQMEEEPKYVNDKGIMVEETKESTHSNITTDRLGPEHQATNKEDDITNAISIDNHAEAMQCLKALQEYAMLNENFRAIGLLTETEKAFKSPPNLSDFEL